MQIWSSSILKPPTRAFKWGIVCLCTIIDFICAFLVCAEFFPKKRTKQGLGVPLKPIFWCNKNYFLKGFQVCLKLFSTILWEFSKSKKFAALENFSNHKGAVWIIFSGLVVLFTAVLVELKYMKLLRWRPVKHILVFLNFKGKIVIMTEW